MNNTKTCKTCKDNDCGICDRTGLEVEDKDTCSKHKPDWREAMIRSFLRRR